MLVNSVPLSETILFGMPRSATTRSSFRAIVASFVRPFVGRTLYKFGGVLGAQVKVHQRLILARLG